MKKYKFLVIIFLCSLLSLNCKKEFLTKLPTTAEVASGISSLSDLQSASNGMYYDLRAVTGNNISGELNSNARTIPILGDLMADNTYLSTLNSGRYISTNNYTFDYTETFGPADIWVADYVSVRDANLILSSKVPASSATSEILGEAYCARALSYFQLVTHFATTYTLAPHSLGVPIVTSTTDLTIKPARSSVDSVYALILSDLTTAYGQMSGFRGSFYFSKWAARALQARVYQFKGDWNNALAASLDVINNGGFALTPINSLADTSKLTAYWANTSMTSGGETIFELNESPTVNNGGNSEAAFYGQGSGTYGDALCTRELYALYSNTDARKNLIYKGIRFGTADSALIVHKYPNYNNPGAKDSEKIIRFAEMYLIAAEAYMNLGDMVNANKYLNILAQNRDPKFAGYNDTGAALLTDILNERRKEFAFEGYRFFDLIRLNLPIVRTAANNEYPAGANLIDVGNFRRIMPIPKSELDVNPNIVQNPSFQK
jgi:hypothetical protein